MQRERCAALLIESHTNILLQSGREAFVLDIIPNWWEKDICEGCGCFAVLHNDLFLFLVITSSIVGMHTSADTTGNHYGVFYQSHRVCQ